MSTLQLYLLGPLELRVGGEPLPKPPTLKSQALLGFLILHREHAQPREQLAGLFWGDRPDRKARQSLATALWHIRRCLPAPELLVSDAQTVQFDPLADYWLDLADFESLAAQDDLASLQSAVVLYRGDFLDGFYDDWILTERYRLETLYTGVLARLMAGQEQEGRYAAALSTAQLLLKSDALREDAHRLLMRAQCHLGQRHLALEQYRRCRKVARDELGERYMRMMAECLSQLEPEVLDVLLEATLLDGFDLDALLKRVTCPAIFVQGDANFGGLEDETARRAAALLPTGHVIKIEGAGHNVHQTRPEAILDTALPFLRTV